MLHQKGREDKTRKGVIGYETVTPYVIGNLVSQGISTNTTPNITIKITQYFKKNRTTQFP